MLSKILTLNHTPRKGNSPLSLSKPLSVLFSSFREYVKRLALVTQPSKHTHTHTHTYVHIVSYHTHTLSLTHTLTHTHTHSHVRTDSVLQNACGKTSFVTPRDGELLI